MRTATIMLLLGIGGAVAACDESSGSGSAAGGVPKGALLLMPGSCPNGYSDATGKFNGRLVFVDTNAVDAPVMRDGDGSHSHGGGDHEHDVTGNINEPTDGYREGGGGRRSPGIRSPIVGKAHMKGHSHDGGAHAHASVGLRLCQR